MAQFFILITSLVAFSSFADRPHHVEVSATKGMHFIKAHQNLTPVPDHDSPTALLSNSSTTAATGQTETALEEVTDEKAVHSAASTSLLSRGNQSGINLADECKSHCEKDGYAGTMGPCLQKTQDKHYRTDGFCLDYCRRAFYSDECTVIRMLTRAEAKKARAVAAEAAMIATDPMPEADAKCRIECHSKSLSLLRCVPFVSANDLSLPKFEDAKATCSNCKIAHDGYCRAIRVVDFVKGSSLSQLPDDALTSIFEFSKEGEQKDKARRTEAEMAERQKREGEDRKKREAHYSMQRNAAAGRQPPPL